MRAGPVRFPVILPALEDTVEFAAPSATQQAAKGLAATRNQAARDLARAAYGSAAKKAAYNRMLGASNDLGDLGLLDYIAARFGPNAVICCAGMPKSGGGATGVFDAVAEIIVRDASGNQIGTRIYMGEAKGGIEWFDIMARQQGRLMTVEGRDVYALRGTREYIQGTAEEMIRPGRPANVQIAGQKILDKIALNRWDELEYEFVSSTWVQQGRRVTGMSPIMQLTKAILAP
jgi:hypothetical protein